MILITKRSGTKAHFKSYITILMEVEVLFIFLYYYLSETVLAFLSQQRYLPRGFIEGTRGHLLRQSPGFMAQGASGYSWLPGLCFRLSVCLLAWLSFFRLFTLGLCNLSLSLNLLHPVLGFSFLFFSFPVSFFIYFFLRAIIKLFFALHFSLIFLLRRFFRYFNCKYFFSYSYLFIAPSLQFVISCYLSFYHVCLDPTCWLRRELTQVYRRSTWRSPVYIPLL